MEDMKRPYVMLDEYLRIRKYSEGIAFVELYTGGEFNQEVLIPVYVSSKAISEITHIDSAILEVSDKTGVNFSVDAKCLRMVDMNDESIEYWNKLMDTFDLFENKITSIKTLFKYRLPEMGAGRIDYNKLAKQIYISHNSESRRNMRVIKKEYIDAEFDIEHLKDLEITPKRLQDVTLIPVKYYTKFYDPTKNERPVSNVENDGYLAVKIATTFDDYNKIPDRKTIEVYDIRQNIMTVDIEDVLVLPSKGRNSMINLNTILDVWFRNSANNFELTHIFYENYKASKK